MILCSTHSSGRMRSLLWHSADLDFNHSASAPNSGIKRTVKCCLEIPAFSSFIVESSFVAHYSEPALYLSCAVKPASAKRRGSEWACAILHYAKIQNYSKFYCAPAGMTRGWRMYIATMADTVIYHLSCICRVPVPISIGVPQATW